MEVVEPICLGVGVLKEDRTQYTLSSITHEMYSYLVLDEGLGLG